MDYKEIIEQFNASLEENKKICEKFEKKLEIIQNQEIILKKGKLEIDLNYIAVQLLTDMDEKKEFLLGKTQLSNKSKLFIEKDRWSEDEKKLLYRRYCHKTKSKVEFFNEYSNSQEVLEILPEPFRRYVAAVKERLGMFQNRVTKSKIDRYGNRKTIDMPIFTQKLKTVIYDQDDYGEKQFKKYDIEHIVVFVELNGSHMNYKIRFEPKKIEKNNLGGDPFNWDHELIMLEKDHVISMEAAMKVIEKYQKKMVRMGDEINNSLVNDLEQTGYSKLLIYREL